MEQSKNGHFGMPDAFPGKEIFVQTSRKKGEKWEQGREISYQQIELDGLNEEQKNTAISLIAKQIWEKLEKPAFLPESQEMPYSQNQFERLLNISGSMMVVAWADKNGEPEPVGYLYGARHGDYPEDLRISDGDVTTTEGVKLPLPDDDTWIFDTFAVDVEKRGMQVGRTLFECMRSKLIPVGKLSKMATFAVEHSLSQTEAMLKTDTLLAPVILNSGLTEGSVPYRGLTAKYMFFDLDKHPVWGNKNS